MLARVLKYSLLWLETLLMMSTGCASSDERHLNDIFQLEQAEQTIVGGIDDEQFYAVGALGLREQDDDSALKVFCSGTLIASEWVLTAAHCANHDASEIRLILGQDLNQQDGVFKEDVTISKIDHILLHELYRPELMVYDIALMHLSEPILNLKPASLSLRDPENFRGETVIAVGYGRTEADVRLKDVRRRQTTLAVKSVGDAFYSVNSDETGICHGDSGGGQFIETDEGFQLAGVSLAGFQTSTSNACVGISFATTIESYRTWIASHVGFEADCRQDAQLCHCEEACTEATGLCEINRCNRQEQLTCSELLALFGHDEDKIKHVRLKYSDLITLYQADPETLNRFGDVVSCFNDASEVPDAGLNALCADELEACEAEVQEVGGRSGCCLNRSHQVTPLWASLLLLTYCMKRHRKRA